MSKETIGIDFSKQGYYLHGTGGMGSTLNLSRYEIFIQNEETPPLLTSDEAFQQSLNKILEKSITKEWGRQKPIY